MASTSLGWWLHQHLGQAFCKWGKQEAGVRLGEDPEAIHQMRVALRRMRALMGGFQAVLDLPRVTRKVGMISRVLGQARDQDVMLARLHDHYLPALPAPEQAWVADLLKDLRQQRRGAQRELVALLTSATYQRVKEAWVNWLDHPRWGSLGDWPVAMALPHLLVIAWGELALHQGWRVVAADADPELLHDLRKAIKRTRYQWEFAQDGAPVGLAEPLALLRQAQEQLGALQDGVVLAEQIGVTCPTLQGLLAQERAEIWQAWQTLRGHYQQGATHQHIYQTLGNRCLNWDDLPPGDGTVHPSAMPFG
ncbi:hypothetical protein GlitD10_0585 [Gloeomargarita lithophora Alchichica-D10]|uniref:CHAD domain-containing protein n=1 Tax=Gloeomargarita lithophora Alchichica-D10 TaxID=1188229 RepID=A0A1J0AAD8_9CYAN|nr:CHAD domain-containing protein [Gloeomargarita lithophora]APB32899.1 hypothetical protein GlitD10_0585 [Gloeomargarita lithophora Alchichica-D10]